MADKPHDISGFFRAVDLAHFFLYEAFDHVHEAARLAVTGSLLDERLPGEERQLVVPIAAFPRSLKQWLDGDHVLDSYFPNEKRDFLAAAWDSAYHDAPHVARRLRKRDVLTSLPDVAGHVVNLAVCLETVVNNHLLYLRESAALEPAFYLILERAELVSKLLFCFKDEVLAKRLNISALKQLVSLRNSAVHFRAASIGSFEVTIEQLVAIWRELGDVFDATVGEPTKADVDEVASEFLVAWVDG